MVRLRRPWAPRWVPRSSTGPSTPGRCTRSSDSASPTAPSVWDAPSCSRRCSPHSSVNVRSTAPAARSSTSSRSSPRSSARPVHWVSVRSRSAEASNRLASCPMSPRRSSSSSLRSSPQPSSLRPYPVSQRAFSGCRTSTWSWRSSSPSSCSSADRLCSSSTSFPPLSVRSSRICRRWRRGPQPTARTSTPGCPRGPSSTGPGGSHGHPSSASSSPASPAVAPCVSSSSAFSSFLRLSRQSGSRSSVAAPSASRNVLSAAKAPSRPWRRSSTGNRTSTWIRSCSISSALCRCPTPLPSS